VSRILLMFSLLLNAPPATAVDDRPTVIVVIGAEGEPQYGQDFATAADRWADAGKRGGARLVQVGRDKPETSDKEQLRKLLEAESKNAKAPLWLVLIGHGTFDGKEAKFNLRGPDFSDRELAEWLKAFQRPLAVIDCSSSSAPFLNKLSGQNRVVITATQSGSELQLSRFGEYMSIAIADPAADLDKDGQTSLLEAFLAAAHNVEEFYKTEGRLATEHALIDDNGDGKGTPASWFQGLRATKAARDNTPLDGPRAHQWHLVMSDAEQAMPADARAKRDELELKIEALRARKGSMTEAEYYRELESLLLQLAPLYQTQPTTPAR
jgi:hypothetical protein